MTKDKARKILNGYLQNLYLTGTKSLPIADEVVYSSKEGRFTVDWTFKGLLELAYNLKEFDD